MSRWPLTAALATLALVGVAVAPRLLPLANGMGTAPPSRSGAVPTPPPTDPRPVRTLPSDALALSLRLDREVVVPHRVEERLLTLTLTPQEDGVVATARPLHLMLVADTSGSMSGEGKIEGVRRAARHLAGALGPEDVLSVVRFSSGASVLLDRAPASGPSAARALAALHPGGGTNLSAGLDVARDRLHGHVDRGLQRVIVLSDGLVNEGDTAPSLLARRVAALQAEGTSVSTVGLGVDFDEDLMAQLADGGGGTYTFVDGATSLTQAFAAELDRTAALVGQRATVRLDLGAHVAPIELLGWEGSQDDRGWTIPVGDLYAGHPKTVVARVRVTAPAAPTVDVATAEVRWVDADGGDHRASHFVQVETSRDAAYAATRVDAEALRLGTRAEQAKQLDLSTRAYARGDHADARRQLAVAKEQARRAAHALRSLGDADGGEAMEADLAQLEVQEAAMDEVAPTSTEGKRLIKLGKGSARAWSH